MNFVPDMEVLLKFGGPIISAMISSGVTYLVFSRTMAANIRTGLLQEEAALRAAYKDDLKVYKDELKDCHEQHEKMERRFNQTVPPLMHILMKEGIEIPRDVLDNL